MARQKSVIKLEGTIGDITFFKTQDGYMAREKVVIPKERIMTDPAFERTRENFSEFGRAGKAGKLLRAAFHTQLASAKDRRLTGRMMQVMMRVLQADSGNARGLRAVHTGEVGFLQGFEMNSHAAFDQTLHSGVQAVIDRASGKAVVDIDEFTPKIAVRKAPGSTHFKIKIAVSEIDFENGVFITKEAISALIPLNNIPQAAFSLNTAFTAGTVKPVILLAGLEFFQEVNGTAYPLKTSDHNPLSVLKVDTV